MWKQSADYEHGILNIAYRMWNQSIEYVYRILNIEYRMWNIVYWANMYYQ